MGQWRKCLTVVIFRSGLIPRCAGLGSLRRQQSAERFQALVAVAVDLVSSSGGRGRLVRQTRNASGT
jgi:hypothetical protein